MTDAKVAKWGAAYEEEPGVAGKVRVKQNFVADDADRFRIRVTDMRYSAQPGALSGEPRPIRVITDSDLGNQLLLYPQYSGGYLTGVYETKWCVLVSNGVDDEYPVNGRADNAMNDQTFRVKLGDTLTISYDAGLNTGMYQAIIHKRVPVRVLKEAKVHVTVMSVAPPPGEQGPPAPVASQAQVDQWLTETNEAYAQVGVRLTWGAVQFANEPAGVTLYNGLQVDPDHEEFAPLLRGKYAGTNQPFVTAATDDVELFFINQFADEDDELDPTLRGLSFNASIVAGTDIADLVDSVLVSVTNKRRFTIAHEIGHTLTDAGHIDDPPATPPAIQFHPNFMRRYTSLLGSGPGRVIS